MQQIQEKTWKEVADIKHHIGTIQSSQLNEDELQLIIERLKYQVGSLAQQVTITKQVKMEINQPVSSSQKQKNTALQSSMRQSDDMQPNQLQKSSGHAAHPRQVILPKILNHPQTISQPTSTQNRPKSKKTVKGKLKLGHMFKATVLPKEMRLNPFADLPVVNDEDLNKGVYNLIVAGVIPKDVNVNAAFRKGGDIIQTQQVQLATEKSRFYSAPQESLARYKLAPQKKQSVVLAQNSQQESLLGSLKVSQSPQKKDIEKILKARYIVEIRNNHYQPDYAFMIRNLSVWGAVQQIIGRLEQIASGQLDGDRIVFLAKQQTKVTLLELYSCYISKPIMERLYKLNKKQFNSESALLKIQATVRMFILHRKYQHQKRIVQKVIRIQKEFRLKQQYVYTINQVKKKLGDHISTLENRQQTFKLEDFSQKRVEIHLPSYTLRQYQRLTMSNFKNREALQLPRLFALKDPALTIIYVTRPLPDEVLVFFQKLLEVAGIDHTNRLHFVHPENFSKFPQHYSLTQLLYFSPKALFQIRQLIQGQFSYIVPMRVGKEEFVLAEILKTNLYTGPFEQIDIFSRKSAGKELFQSLGFPVAPGYNHFANKEDFVNKLTLLISTNMFVQRWYFKVDVEMNGRGTAIFSLEGVKQYHEMKSNPNLLEFNALRELIAALLPIKTVFPFPQMLTWDEYLEYFLSNGGIIEASPTAARIQTISLVFDIEPGGGYQIMNSATNIVVKDMIRVGCVYPQNILNLNADSLIMPLADALYKKGIFGYVTLSLLTFNGMFYVKSMRFGMDEQVAGNLLASAMDSESFTYLPFLFNPALMEQNYADLFVKCRKEGVSFDIEKRIGTLLLLSDSLQNGVLSLLCLGQPKRSIKLATEALNFLMQFGATAQKSNTIQKTDIFYFIDIVGKMRNLNSEYQ